MTLVCYAYVGGRLNMLKYTRESHITISSLTTSIVYLLTMLLHFAWLPRFTSANNRCGACLPNRQPQHFRDRHPHHTFPEQPRPAGRSPHPTPHLRLSLRPRHGAREEQRRSRGTSRPPSEGGTGAQEDQSWKRVVSFGGALPDPGFRQRPVLRHHHWEASQDLQAREDT